MKKPILLARRWIRDHSGATSIEYALIATLIAVVIVTALTAIGTSLSNGLQQVASGFSR